MNGETWSLKVFITPARVAARSASGSAWTAIRARNRICAVILYSTEHHRSAFHSARSATFLSSLGLRIEGAGEQRVVQGEDVERRRVDPAPFEAPAVVRLPAALAARAHFRGLSRGQ